MKRERLNAFLLVVVALAGVFSFATVVYAAFSTTLKITGAATIKAVDWNVHFTRVDSTANVGNSIDASNAGPNLAATTPTLSDLELTGFTATFEYPGDYVEFTADIKNDGSLNAVLDSINGANSFTCTAYTDNTSSSVADQAACTHLDMKILDTNGNDFETNQTTLNAGETKTVKVRIDFYEDYAGEAYTLSKDLKVTVSDIAFLYKQAVSP